MMTPVKAEQRRNSEIAAQEFKFCRQHEDHEPEQQERQEAIRDSFSVCLAVDWHNR